MSHWYHPPCFHNPNNIWWRIRTMKPLIMKFSPFPYSLSLRSKYSPQNFASNTSSCPVPLKSSLGQAPLIGLKDITCRSTYMTRPLRVHFILSVQIEYKKQMKAVTTLSLKLFSVQFEIKRTENSLLNTHLLSVLRSTTRQLTERAISRKY
jgi:hypothetical protein